MPDCKQMFGKSSGDTPDFLNCGVKQNKNNFSSK